MGNKLKCPKCKREVTWENNPYRPFCSKVCKLADLYSWLEEEYRIKISDDIIKDFPHVELELKKVNLKNSKKIKKE